MRESAILAAYSLSILACAIGCANRHELKLDKYESEAFRDYVANKLFGSQNQRGELSDFNVTEVVRAKVIVVVVSPKETQPNHFGSSPEFGADAFYYFEKKSGKLLKTTIGT